MSPRPLDYSMRRAINRASIVVFREAKRETLRLLEIRRATCTHPRARFILRDHKGITVHLCIDCLRLIVHDPNPR